MVELLKRLISYPIRYLPSLRKRFWTQFYNFVARAVDHDDFIYMNLGYADLDARTDELNLEEPGELHRFSDELYRHVAGAVDLRDQDVLEIGCGRGGGSAYVMQSLKPRTLTAVDISGRAIERCHERYQIEGLSFQQADAESLPFEDDRFDAVVSVESSNVYSSRARFLAEVRRVLRPKGYFLYTDMANPWLDKMSIENLHELLNHCGLSVLKAENISRNVLKARELLSESSQYRECLARWTGSYGTKRTQLLSDIFCLKGSACYQRLETGETEYWCWVMQKPGRHADPRA